jgi:hypothetical protein
VSTTITSTDAGVDQQARPLVGVLSHAQGGADDQPAPGVLGRQRVLVALDEVLDGDQPAQPAALVDQRELLDLVLGEQGQRGVGVDAHRRGDQRHRRHDVADEPVLVGLEPHVAVGDDAEEHAVGVDHGRPGDAVAGRERVDLGEGVLGADGDRVGHHAGLGPLDQVDLAGLLLGGQVAVQHAHAADARHGDGHPRLGDRVHRAGQQRHREADRPRHAAAGVHLGRDHVGLPRDQEDVVVGQPQGRELGRELGHRSRQAVVECHRVPPPSSREPSSDRRRRPVAGRAPVRRLPWSRRGTTGSAHDRRGGRVDPFDGVPGPDHEADRPGPPPLTMEERAGVLDDLAELEVFRTLLEPTGIKGIVVDCPDCDEEHHVDWALMQANLRQLLEEGQTGRHEPPFDPDPDDYVSWDYASGYADGIAAAAERDEEN